MKKVKAWKLSGLAESFADVCRKLRFEVPAQIQYKFLYLQDCLLVSTFIPGEGRDDLHLALYPFCQILSFGIYFI